MKTISFALILLAGAAAFSGVARADETDTAANQESARVARLSSGVILGSAPAAESAALGLARPAAPSRSNLSAKERISFILGDRGLGNN